MNLDMPKISGWFGAGLAAFGIAMYIASGQSSMTALIPSAFGVVLAGLSLLCRCTSSPKHPMHAAAAVALVGFAGSANGLPGGLSLLAGQTVELPLAAASKSVMALALGVFLGLCVISFRQARKARE